MEILTPEIDGYGYTTNVLCGECARPIPECLWMSKGKPVPGWTAERSALKMGGKPAKSWHITRCPLFIKHPRSVMFDEEGNRVRV